MLTVPSPDRSLCWASLWSLFLLTALLLVLESRFFPTYGLVVDLPPSPHLAEEPAMSRHAVALLESERCIFGGEICSWDRLGEKLRALEPRAGEVLLLHCKGHTPLAGLLRVGELARRAGFDSLQIAIPRTCP
ncbi:MAG: hypothetical protein LBT98_03935 [Puniceicoccales bacterium]|jgi:hypothetical protein|nr:hypothetical protein [Puniceicoccales bacterium]